MLPPIRYLAYASEHFGRARYDLASSGLASLPPEELVLPVGAAADLGAPARFAQAIARRYGVTAAEVVPCLGASQALWAAVAALSGPGRVVAVEEPGYEPLFRVAEGLGARVTRFVRRPEDRYAVDPERVAAAAGDGGLAIVSDPHNPTGVRADPEALRETARRLARRGGVLLVDEVYRDFLVDKEGPGTARTLGENVVVISSLTKVYGLSWARAGWILGGREVVAAVAGVLAHAVGWNPPVCAAAGAAALADIDRLAARSRALRGKKLERAARFVDEHRGLSWIAPDGGLFGFVRTEPLLDVGALNAGPLRARGVMVADGAFFDRPGWFRLGVALDEPLVDEALRLLGEAVDEAQQRPPR